MFSVCYYQCAFSGLYTLGVESLVWQVAPSYGAFSAAAIMVPDLELESPSTDPNCDVEARVQSLGGTALPKLPFLATSRAD